MAEPSETPKRALGVGGWLTICVLGALLGVAIWAAFYGWDLAAGTQMDTAGVVALDKGDDFIAHQVARARKSRDLVCEVLARSGRCRFAPPRVR